MNEKGYRAECINVGSTAKLVKYEEYYVYPITEDKFYVSRFPYPKRTWQGIYNKIFFKLKEDIPEIEYAAVDAAIEEIPVTEEDPLEEVQMSLF